MNSHSEVFLQAILATLARQTFPMRVLAEIVAPPGASRKQVEAYNMCDGTKTQGQIAKKLKLDSGNFSRTVARWVDAGVLFRVGEGRECKLIHVYPLTHEPAKKRKDNT